MFDDLQRARKGGLGFYVKKASARIVLNCVKDSATL